MRSAYAAETCSNLASWRGGEDEDKTHSELEPRLLLCAKKHPHMYEMRDADRVHARSYPLRGGSDALEGEVEVFFPERGQGEEWFKEIANRARERAGVGDGTAGKNAWAEEECGAGVGDLDV